MWSSKEYPVKEKVASAAFKVDYEYVIGALHNYNSIYGNTDVPSEFVVPESSRDWNESYYNMKLGYYVAGILNRGKLRVRSVDVLKQLDELKFPWFRSAAQIKISEKVDLILECLRVYKRLYNNLYVGQLFVVPDEPPWPEAAWGMRLGSRVGTIRTSGSYIGTDIEKRYKGE